MNDEFYDLTYVDVSTPEKIIRRAKHLENMTFREVVELNINPDVPKDKYNNPKDKGGMGKLIEECFFNFSPNSRSEADFKEARVELKATCFDRNKKGEIKAGERLVLSMIPYDKPIDDELNNSHLWEKCSNILLIYYERDRNIDKLDQRIHHAVLFTPPPEDLKIIEEDYKTIVSMIKSGHAEDLSEGMTMYLGACTKGASSKSVAPQFYGSHVPAKRRAFCFKTKYMNHILDAYILGNSNQSNKIVSNLETFKNKTFQELVLEKINSYAGKTDKELCKIFDIDYQAKDKKGLYSRIIYAMLGIKGNHAEEFDKANISVHTVRYGMNGKNKEHLPVIDAHLDTISEDAWEDCKLHEYFETQRFLFVLFQKEGDSYVLKKAKFWSMPQKDIEGYLRICWEETQRVIQNGIILERVSQGTSEIVKNNLPCSSRQPIAHVRPHASNRWYRFVDGTTIGDNPSNGVKLPNGIEITRQSFWLNNSYIKKILDE